MKYFLIPGYGVGAQYVNFKQPEGLNAGFGAFEELIKQNQATVFRWDINRYFGWLEFINPLKHLELYKMEESKSQSKNTHDQLQLELFTAMPRTIICHSMGSQLLISYLQSHKLPDSVIQIIFIQSNIPSKQKLPDYLQNLLRSKRITLINLFCPWDQALISLIFLRFFVPAGMVGLKNNPIINIFFPLYKTPNLHTSSISDPKLIKLIET